MTVLFWANENAVMILFMGSGFLVAGWKILR